MVKPSALDAIVVGSGPNGLAAAVALAGAQRRVLLVEGRDRLGGGTRSAELTLPGYTHDVCAAIFALAAASPFLGRLPLARHGLTYVYAPVALAHPFDDGSAAVLRRSVGDTAAGLGADGAAYRSLFSPLVNRAPALLSDILAPLRPPRHPLPMALFGPAALLPASALARLIFRGEPARALFAGLAAHGMLPLDRPLTAAFGLTLALAAHAVGWPMVMGGSQQFATAMTGYLRELGGEVVTGSPVVDIADLPPAKAVLFDLTPRPLLRVAGTRLSDAYRRKLAGYRYGPGVCKVDYALAAPVPWRALACREAAVVHLGGTMAEVAEAEQTVAAGGYAERPFVIATQQSLWDPTRAPAGRHTLWTYCHVPNGSTRDVGDAVDSQIERFAPGFRDLVLFRNVRTAAQVERENPNFAGGDINGGAQDWRQLFTRPVASLAPYATPAEGIYLCSAATPPGGGVHGMCGYWAAQTALRNELAR